MSPVGNGSWLAFLFLFFIGINIALSENANSNITSSVGQREGKLCEIEGKSAFQPLFSFPRSLSLPSGAISELSMSRRQQEWHLLHPAGVLVQGRHQ